MRDREMRRKGTENQVRGGAEELKGKVRSKVGDVRDDRSQQLSGKAEELKGKIRRKFGEKQEDIARDEEPNERGTDFTRSDRDL